MPRINTPVSSSKSPRRSARTRQTHDDAIPNLDLQALIPSTGPTLFVSPSPSPATSDDATTLEQAYQMIVRLSDDNLKSLLRSPRISGLYQVHPVIHRRDRKGKMTRVTGPALTPKDLGSTQVSSSQAQEAPGEEDNPVEDHAVTETVSASAPDSADVVAVRKRARPVTVEDESTEEAVVLVPDEDEIVPPAPQRRRLLPDRPLAPPEISDSVDEPEDTPASSQLLLEASVPSASAVTGREKPVPKPSGSARPAKSSRNASQSRVEALVSDLEALPKVRDPAGRAKDLLAHAELFGSKDAVQQLFDVLRTAGSPQAFSDADAGTPEGSRGPNVDATAQALVRYRPPPVGLGQLVRHQAPVGLEQAAAVYRNLEALDVGRFRSAVMRRVCCVVLARHVAEEADHPRVHDLDRTPPRPGQTKQALAQANLFAQIHPDLSPEKDKGEYARQRKNFERQLAVGRRWLQLVESFGVGILILVPAEFPESWWYRGVGATLGELFGKHLRLIQPQLAPMCERAQLHYDHLTGGSGNFISSTSFITFRRDLLQGTDDAPPPGSLESRRSLSPSPAQGRLLPADEDPSTPPSAQLPYVRRLASQVSGWVYATPTRSGPQTSPRTPE